MSLLSKTLRKCKLPKEEGDGLEKRFVEGGLDEDFLQFLDHRPKSIAVSMLASQKSRAQKVELDF